MLLFVKDFEALNPNLLARTVETVEGGGIVCLLLRTMNSLKQLYTLNMVRKLLCNLYFFHCHIHTHTHTYMHTCIHAHMHTRTHTHKHTHTHHSKTHVLILTDTCLYHRMYMHDTGQNLTKMLSEDLMKGIVYWFMSNDITILCQVFAFTCFQSSLCCDWWSIKCSANLISCVICWSHTSCH